MKSGPKHFCAFICSEVKFISCVSGGFSGGLLPVLPFCRQKRPERVLAVREMTRYGKSSEVMSAVSEQRKFVIYPTADNAR